jgi:hypothetical protein
MKNKLLLLFSVIIFFACNPTGKKDKQKKDFSFTPVTACIFSEIAYCSHPQDTLDKYLPGWKIIWNPASAGGNYAFAAANDNKYVVAIRGSLLQFSRDAFNNWIEQDLHVAKQQDWPFADSGSRAKISQGSYEGWRNMNEMNDKGKTLWQLLDSVIKPDTELLITGHSLGGNLATVYASWLSWNFNKDGNPQHNINVITFAAPAAGNADFANDFNQKFPKSVRVENILDIVPKFPVAESIGDLVKLYEPAPAATKIETGFSFVSVKLSTVFSTLEITLKGLELINGNSVYTQTNGSGYPVTIKLSGKNNKDEIADWFAEAGYQHGIIQYAAALGAPVIEGN